MVFVRKKGAMDWPHPKYDFKSKYLTVVVYFGGQFVNMPNTVYEGGDRLVFDWIKADELKVSDLVEFRDKAGIKADCKYHLRMRDGSFKMVCDDEDLRLWANMYLVDRELHIYIEVIEVESAIGDEPQNEFQEILEVESDLGSDYDSFEDSDFVIGCELTDNDDEIFEGEVEIVEGDLETVDPNNMFDGTMSVWVDNLRDMSESENPSEFGGGNMGESGAPQSINGKDKGKKLVEAESESENEDESDFENDVVDGDLEDFDEHRLSEDDDEAPSAPVFNPQTTFNPEFILSQMFASKKDFRKAVQSHAIKNRRNVHFPKNDKRRIYAKCVENSCKWHIHALKKEGELTFQIRKYYSKHTCAPSQKVKNLTATWLMEKFVQKFHSDGNRDVNGFMLDAQREVRCEVSRNQAYRAKYMALAKIEGDADVQYSKLWSYVEELRKSNPGSTIILGTTEDRRFDRFYVCWNAMKKGFLAGCRPIIGVDGCFLKSKYGGNLLTAVGVDGNNNLFPVAYVVVEKENGEIWEWFLRMIKRDLEIDGEEFTFISDKQKGLISALNNVFPGTDHRFCVRHMHNNMKSAGFNGLAYKQVLWKAAMSTTKGEYKAAMEEMKELNQAAWKWFNNKPPKQWSKAYFSEKSKCDILLNNVCESFNSTILISRDKSIITMLEWIREYLMKRLQKNRDTASMKWTKQLCPRIQKILERNTEMVSDCIPIKGNDIHYQVSCFDGRQFTVDLAKHTCSCRAWQLTGIPCSHGICAILRQGLNPIAFVNECYTVSTYLKAYEHTIYGINHDQLWGDTLYIPPMPPNFGKRPARGRKGKKRRLEKGEKEGKGVANKRRMKRQQTTIKCSKCRLPGHNAKTCKAQRREGEGSGTVVNENEKKGAQKKGRKKVHVQESTSAHEDDEVLVAPPIITNEEDDSEIHIDTQVSTITSCNQPIPQPIQGPSMHDQLQLGQPKASRVHMRKPPRFGEGHFSRTPFVPPQSKEKNKVIVEGGQKYIHLSSQTSKKGKGKKK